MHLTFVGYSWNIQGIFLYSIFLEHYFGNIPRNLIGNFFQIFWEYIMGMFQEYSTNTYLPGGWSQTFLSADLNDLAQIEKFMVFLYSFHCSWVSHFIGILLARSCAVARPWSKNISAVSSLMFTWGNYHPSPITNITHHFISRRWSSQMVCDAGFGWWKILITMAHTSPVYEKCFQIHVDEKR